MSLLPDRTQRRIVPRWRASGAAAAAPEFTSVKAAPRATSSSADQAGAAFRAFQDDRSVGSAAEALAESLLEGNREAAKTAAIFIAQNPFDAPASLLNLARSTTGELSSITAIASEVATTRALLKLSPRNPVLWSDMARHYASQGEKQRARRCMSAALQLAPDHRWMLRTAARFFIHQEDPAAAHRLLSMHPRTKNDPWLIAAELACAHVAGRTPKFWKVANEIIKFDRYSPLHISELATAVGMMELESGNRKQARKLVQKGLIAPTENTLAQVLWAKDRKHLGDGMAKLNMLIKSTEDAYEAEFKLCLQRGDLPAALSACNNWVSDEPFAARPLHEITYLASLLDDHDLTFRTSDRVLRLDGQMSVGLELNRMFAKLSSNKLRPDKDADEIHCLEVRLRQLIAQPGAVAVHATANMALWNYRFGSAEAGRALYRSAVELARKSQGLESAAHAAMFAAREALLSGEPEAPQDLATAADLAERAGSELCLFYVRKLDALAKAPGMRQQILSPSSAEQYLRPMKLLNISKGPTGYVLTVGRG